MLKNNNKDPKKQIKNQNLIISLLVIVTAVLLILTIVFGVKYSHYKSETKDSNIETTTTIQLDVDGDNIPDYKYVIKGHWFGYSMYDVTSNSDNMENKMLFSYGSSTMGHFLNSIKYDDNGVMKTFEGGVNGAHTYIQLNSFYDGKSEYLNTGVDGIILGRSSSYLFHLASW